MISEQCATWRRRNRARYAQRKALGQCARCTAPPPPGYVYCADYRRDSSQARGSRVRGPHVMVAWQDEQALVSTWARRYGMHPVTLRYRLRRGWDFAEAVTTPVKAYRPRQPKPPEVLGPPFDTQALAAQLRFDEGMILHVYRDSRGQRTAGVGHLLPKASPLPLGSPITNAQAETWLQEDIAKALQDCHALWPAFATYPEAVQQILANMAFNLGRARLAGFRDVRAAVERHDWAAAADAMVDSQWYQQVGLRSQRLVAQMRAVAKQQGLRQEAHAHHEQDG